MKRLAPIALLFFVACSDLSPAQHTSATNALKSLQKIQAATEVGVNYNNYGQLLIDAKAQVNEAAKLLPDGGVKTEVNAAMECYKDASDAWAQKIEFSGYIPSTISPGKELASKYMIPITNEVGLSNLMKGDVALSMIWAEGKKHIENVDKLLR